MEGFLKLSTSVNVTVLMIDSSDHITGKTGLTLTIYLTKAAGTPASIAPTVTELDSTNVKGLYKLALATTSWTDTLGELELHITATGADPADYKWQVSTYLPGEAATLQADQAVNTTKVGGTTQTARDIGLDTKSLAAGLLLRTGTAQSGTGNTITLDAGASASNQFYKHFLCVIVGGTGAGQCRVISDYQGGSKVATVFPAFAGVGADNTSVFQLVSFSTALVDYIGNLFTLQADVGVGCDNYSAQIGTMTFTGANINAHLAAGQLFFKKNTALNNFPFLMRDSTTHAPKASLTVSATRRIDNGTFAACANAVAEIGGAGNGNGWYTINLAATDVNGTTIAFRFTAAGADDLDFTVITQS